MSAFAQFMALAMLGVAAGVSVTVQQALNAGLRTALGSPSWAALVSYLVGALTIGLMLVVIRTPMPSSATLAATPLWSWTGGFFGAIFIFLAIVLMPRLGAATVMALIVAGQMLASIAIDHMGLFGLAPHPVDLSRLVGAALLIVAVYLIQN